MATDREGLLRYLATNLARYVIAVVLGAALAIGLLIGLGFGPLPFSLEASINGFVFAVLYLIAIGAPLASLYLVGISRLAPALTAQRSYRVAGAGVVGLLFIFLLFMGPILEGHAQLEWLALLIPWLGFGLLIRPISAKRADKASA